MQTILILAPRVLFIYSNGQLTVLLQLPRQKHGGANYQVLGDAGAEVGLAEEDGSAHGLNFSLNESHPQRARCWGPQTRKRPRACQAPPPIPLLSTVWSFET